MKEKKLLIVERSNAPLNYSVEQALNENNEHSDSIVLTGLFTSFNTKNRNGRIYESADFLPHVEALREQIESKRLLGELDHPHGFEISLGNVSHVVESLEFDPQQNAIVGKIRLLNTTAGKEAQALVKDGIPLNISSRAAGTVDESGHVKLQQLFTYDLVADPGFANAQLKRVNESYGFGDDDNIDIYDISEDANTELDPHVTKTADYAEPQAARNEDTLKNTNMEDNKEFIQYGDFQKYSEHLSEIVGELQSAISNIKDELISYKEKGGETPTQTFSADSIDNSMIADLVAKEVARVTGAGAAEVGGSSDAKIAELENKVAAAEEAYNNLKAYTKYLAETLDKSITHQDYIVDEANKIIAHNNYLVEKMNQMVGHQDYIAEKMNQMVAHQDYLAENINDTISYQNYIAEMLDKSIDYSNMLAEEQNKSIAHNNYLVEKMNQMVEHQDYIVEEVNKIGNNIIEEKKSEPVPEETKVEDKVNEENKPAEEVKVEETKTEPVVEEEKFDAKAYQSALTEKLDAILAAAKAQYEEAKKAEAEALAESKKNVDTKNFTPINYMPSRLNEKWSKLSDERKQEILEEAKMFVINNEASAEYFWNTRDFRDKQVELQKIEESAVAQPNAINENVVSEERLNAMKEQIQRRMRRW
jgi:uncharacterized coiled-coil protein SlyX